MSDVTRLLDAAAGGDWHAAADLLPIVYDELRRLAAQRLAHESPGQTLDATGLVHEAYLRLVGGTPNYPWNTRGHFFGAAAEAMRRILVERARQKQRKKHGGERRRVEFDEALVVAAPADDLLDIDEALTALEVADPIAAKLVELRYFARLPMADAAAALGISLRSAERNWTYAKTWLLRKLTPPASDADVAADNS